VLTNQELKTTDGMDLALRGIGAGDLTGTSGHDTFDVSGWAGTLTLHGGGCSLVICLDTWAPDNERPAAAAGGYRASWPRPRRRTDRRRCTR
jgi:hypothetical protein